MSKESMCGFSDFIKKISELFESVSYKGQERTSALTARAKLAWNNILSDARIDEKFKNELLSETYRLIKDFNTGVYDCFFENETGFFQIIDKLIRLGTRNGVIEKQGEIFQNTYKEKYVKFISGFKKEIEEYKTTFLPLSGKMTDLNRSKRTAIRQARTFSEIYENAAKILELNIKKIINTYANICQLLQLVTGYNANPVANEIYSHVSNDVFQDFLVVMASNQDMYPQGANPNPDISLINFDGINCIVESFEYLCRLFGFVIIEPDAIEKKLAEVSGKDLESGVDLENGGLRSPGTENGEEDTEADELLADVDEIKANAGDILQYLMSGENKIFDRDVEVIYGDADGESALSDMRVDSVMKVLDYKRMNRKAMMDLAKKMDPRNENDREANSAVLRNIVLNF